MYSLLSYTEIDSPIRFMPVQSSLVIDQQHFEEAIQ